MLWSEFYFHPLGCVCQCFLTLAGASLCKRGRAMHISRVENVLNDAMQIDESAGIYRCRRDIFTDPDLFELEMKYLFEGGWVYLAHESQIADVNDYFTTHIGRQPIVITRDKNNELHAFIMTGAPVAPLWAPAATAIRGPLPDLSTAGQSVTTALFPRSTNTTQTKTTDT